MGEPILEARGITKVYRQGSVETPVLHGIDFSIRPGELVAILGPSGSGKSTLLNILGLMDEPSAGTVLIDAVAVSGLGEEGRSRLRNQRLGFVFQFDSLLSEFMVLENVTLPGRIALPSRGGSVAALEAAASGRLERLGLAKHRHKFPQQLSGGERQRVAIARALLNSPAALLADEPTGNLDRANGELVFSTLREQAESLGVAVMLVTHNEEAARFASRTVHLSDGRLEILRPKGEASLDFWFSVDENTSVVSARTLIPAGAAMGRR